MKVTEIKDILERYSLSPNKQYGQNFLVSGSAASKIAELAASCAAGHILEVGPGLGAVTEKLLETGYPLTAVEIDSGLCSYLADRFGGRPGFTLVHADFLKHPPEKGFDTVVSNLPYYCASEILFKTALEYSPETILVMMQSEMAGRLSAPPGSKAYGAFTVSLGLYYSPETVFHAGPGDFYPPPDVRSSFVRLKSKENPFKTKEESGLFHSIVKSAFWARRRTLVSALAGSPHGDFDRGTAAALIRESGFPPEVRGEQLSTGEFVKLTELWRDHEKSR